MPVEEGLATSPSDRSSRLFTFMPSITPLKPGSVFSCRPKYSPHYACHLQTIERGFNSCHPEESLTCPCLGGACSRGLWGGRRDPWQGPGVCPPRGVTPPPPYMEPCCLDWQLILPVYPSDGLWWRTKRDYF